MKIGIFLAYGPQTELTSEGLGRYLGSLMKGFQDSGNSLYIACPQWLMNSLSKLCIDFGIDKSAIDWCIVKKHSILWDIYQILLPKKKVKKSPIKFLIAIGGFIENITAFFISISSVILLVVVALLCLSIALVSLPFLLLGGVFYFSFKFLKAVKNKSTNKLKSIFSLFNKFYRKFMQRGISFNNYLSSLRDDKLQSELIKKINQHKKNGVDVWFSPAFFWPAFNEIEGVKVLNAPDLVTSRFPGLFATQENYTVTTDKIRKTINNGTYFITYCNYLKRTLLVEEFGVDNLNVKVITHATNNLKGHIYIDEKLTQRLNHQKGDYFNHYDFTNVKYIFYSSQTRPHKNMLTLIKAYEYLLRRKYCNVKLFLTGETHTVPEIKNYILSNRLQYDVISFRNVSIKELASLYHCAEIVVNPTLYEGGFPFTFGEGMSVGTPSIMSDIPQVREVFDGYGLEDCLFDPYDYLALADKMEYAVNHRAELYEKQLPLYQKLADRTPEVMANEYIEAFQNFLSMGMQPEKEAM